MAAPLDTVRVRWPAKFKDRLVTINATDFDPAIHRLVDDDVQPQGEAAPAVEVQAPPRRRGRSAASW